MADAVIALEYDPSDPDSRDQWWRWLNILKPPRIFRVRTFECASLELCWVAAGNLAGYLHPSDHAWDMAAGGLVAREAGCDVFSADWQPWDPLGRGIVATAPEVAAELMPVLQAR
ncbi:MAG: hypothetical protein HYT78_00315 [Deltaproteobacteria bacterium]|nr:hypothetical protein [Deltaproteobacteria bacterium]